MNHPFHPMRALLAIPLLSLGSWGCVARTVVQVQEEDQRHRAMTDKYVLFRNASVLSRSLVLEQVTRDPDAVPTVVQFTLRNTWKEPVDFMYRCSWLDENGLEIAFSTDTWAARTLQGKERMNLRCVAPNPHAVDYRLELRPWQRQR